MVVWSYVSSLVLFRIRNHGISVFLLVRTHSRLFIKFLKEAKQFQKFKFNNEFQQIGALFRQNFIQNLLNKINNFSRYHLLISLNCSSFQYCFRFLFMDRFSLLYILSNINYYLLFLNRQNLELRINLL